MANITEQVYNLSKLAALRGKMKDDVVLIGGVFDILHIGHVEHLREAKSLGSTLVVHVTSDKRVREKKGPTRPVNSELDRAKLIAAIKFVDYVFIDDQPHYMKRTIETLKPNILLLNTEAVSEEIKAYLDKEIASLTKVVVSDKPKLNNTSDILKELETGN